MRALTTRTLPVLVLAGASVAVPSTALAASSSGPRSSERPLAAASICSKVSGAAVSKIIGYKLPNASTYTFTTKATAANFGVAATTTTCTYGAETSMASILRAVTLSFETLSKPLTTSQMQKLVKKDTSLAKFVFSPYPGLGAPAFYFTLTESGITGQGISIDKGLHYYGASVETGKTSKAKVAALASLAEKL